MWTRCAVALGAAGLVVAGAMSLSRGAVSAAGPGGRSASAGSAPADPPITLPRTVRADGRPQINGPRIASATPGRPFLFHIPATGEGPLSYAVENLPAGLVVDAATGNITGSLKEAGATAVTVHVRNARGECVRHLVIVGGQHKLALTPPLGWNSWNAVGMRPTDGFIRAAADGMVSSGLADHGFDYVCIDDGWEVPTAGRGLRGSVGVAGVPRRDPEGVILCNAGFPNMKDLGDYIHGKGLKFGIYSSPGPTTCQGFEASWQHEELDVRTWASWGVDYVKYDWCSYDTVAQSAATTAGGGRAGRGGGRGRNYDLVMLKKPYQVLRAALDRQDRDMVLSMCQYGMGNSWEWGAEDGINANLWRSTNDIRDNWPQVSRIGFSQNGHESYTGPGHWNDTDMLVVGKVGWTYEPQHEANLTPNEQLTHISLWAILAAPMILGCDMSKLEDFTIRLMSNDEVLAVDQDPLGSQGKRIRPASPADNPNASANAPQQVWARRLWDGTMAVGLFNLGDAPARVSISRAELNDALKMNIPAGVPVRDLWQLKDVAALGDMIAVDFPRHGCVLLKVGLARAEAACIADLVARNQPR